LVAGKVPLKFVFKQILIVSPFIIFLAASSMFYNRQAVTLSFGAGQIETTAGAVRCAGILIKFVITMAALLGLMATTRFGELLDAMGRLGVPKILTMQISFVYRFIFLMIDRGHHILMARNARRIGRMSFKREVGTAAAMGGSLFLGSIDTANKVNMSMLARGFDGTFHGISKTKFKKADTAFLGITAGYVGLLIILSKVL
jgi:cobalt/nickel transport system permease protein